MKRILFTILVLALTASVSMANYTYDGPVPAAFPDGYFTLTTHDMATFNLLPGGGLGHAIDMDPSAPGIGADQMPTWNNTEFQFYFEEDPGSWRSGQLGWKMEGGPGTMPSEYFNLSGWDGWTVSFHNENMGAIPYNLEGKLFLNLGWTDSPWSEYNLYVAGEPMLAPYCEFQYLTMDYSNVEAWGMSADGLTQYAGEMISILDDPRLLAGHASALGVQIGSSDYPDYDDGLMVKVCLDRVIPAPGAIILGSIGVGLVGWLRRRRTL